MDPADTSASKFECSNVKRRVKYQSSILKKGHTAQPMETESASNSDSDCSKYFRACPPPKKRRLMQRQNKNTRRSRNTKREAFAPVDVNHPLKYRKKFLPTLDIRQNAVEKNLIETDHDSFSSEFEASETEINSFDSDVFVEKVVRNSDDDEFELSVIKTEPDIDENITLEFVPEVAEVFVCSPFHTNSEIAESLTSCDRPLVVKFYKIDFTSMPLSLWQQKGGDMESLTFINCTMTDETFENIIRDCKGLKNLCVQYQGDTGRTLCSTECLGELLSSSVINSSLEKLDLTLKHGEYVPNSLLDKLFSIFPKIANISIKYEECKEMPELWRKISRDSNNENPIEKLEIDIKNCEFGSANAFWEEFALAAATQLLSLQEIHCTLSSTKATETMVEFLSKQENLLRVHVTIYVFNMADPNSTILMRNLLSSCSKLTDVALISNGVFNLDRDLFKDIAASKLKSLALDFSGIRFSSYYQNKENENLEKLDLRGIFEDEDVRKFLSTFRRLTTLKLSGTVTNTILQMIWKYQVNLVNLKVAKFCSVLSDFGFTGCGWENTDFRISTLEKLESLEVAEPLGSQLVEITNVTIRELALLNLKHLLIHAPMNADIAPALEDKIGSFGSLESLILICRVWPACKWENLGDTSVKHLKTDTMVEVPGLLARDKAVLELFRRSPQLRIFINSKSNDVYFFDVLHNEVKRKQDVFPDNVGIPLELLLWPECEGSYK